jgi:hypothetical protein
MEEQIILEKFRQCRLPGDIRTIQRRMAEKGHETRLDIIQKYINGKRPAHQIKFAILSEANSITNQREHEKEQIKQMAAAAASN